MIEQRLAHWANEHTHANAHRLIYTHMYEYTVVNERWDEKVCLLNVSKRTCFFSVILRGLVIRRMFFVVVFLCTLDTCWEQKLNRFEWDVEKRVDATTKIYYGLLLCFAIDYQRLQWNFCQFKWCSHGSITQSLTTGSTMFSKIYEKNDKSSGLAVCCHPMNEYSSISCVCRIWTFHLIWLCVNINVSSGVINIRSKNARKL